MKQLVIERLIKIEKLSQEIQIDLHPFNHKSLLNEDLNNLNENNINANCEFYYLELGEKKLRIKKNLLLLNDSQFNNYLSNIREEITSLTKIISSSLCNEYKNVVCQTSTGFQKFFDEEKSTQFVTSILSKINKYGF